MEQEDNLKYPPKKNQSEERLYLENNWWLKSRIILRFSKEYQRVEGEAGGKRGGGGGKEEEKGREDAWSWQGAIKLVHRVVWSGHDLISRRRQEWSMLRRQHQLRSSKTLWALNNIRFDFISKKKKKKKQRKKKKKKKKKKKRKKRRKRKKLLVTEAVSVTRSLQAADGKQTKVLRDS